MSYNEFRLLTEGFRNAILPPGPKRRVCMRRLRGSRKSYAGWISGISGISGMDGMQNQDLSVLKRTDPVQLRRLHQKERLRHEQCDLYNVCTTDLTYNRRPVRSSSHALRLHAPPTVPKRAIYIGSAAAVPSGSTAAFAAIRYTPSEPVMVCPSPR